MTCKKDCQSIIKIGDKVECIDCMRASIKEDVKNGYNPQKEFVESINWFKLNMKKPKG